MYFFQVLTHDIQRCNATNKHCLDKYQAPPLLYLFRCVRDFSTSLAEGLCPTKVVDREQLLNLLCWNLQTSILCSVWEHCWLQTAPFLLFEPVLRVRFSVKPGRAVVLKILYSCVIIDVARPVRPDVPGIDCCINPPPNFFHEFGSEIFIQFFLPPPANVTTPCSKFSSFDHAPVV